MFYLKKDQGESEGEAIPFIQYNTVEVISWNGDDFLKVKQEDCQTLPAERKLLWVLTELCYSCEIIWTVDFCLLKLVWDIRILPILGTFVIDKMFFYYLF